MAMPWHELEVLDRPEILQFIFYPRRDFFEISAADNVIADTIPVDKTVSVSYCFYFSDKKHPISCSFMVTARQPAIMSLLALPIIKSGRICLWLIIEAMAGVEASPR